MRDKILWLLAGAALAACVIGGVIFWRAANVDISRVDVSIRDGIASADAELEALIEHKPELITRVEVIRHETTQRILALGADDLVAVALARAEAFRRRLAASDDTQSAAGLAGR